MAFMILSLMAGGCACSFCTPALAEEPATGFDVVVDRLRDPFSVEAVSPLMLRQNIKDAKEGKRVVKPKPKPKPPAPKIVVPPTPPPKIAPVRPSLPILKITGVIYSSKNPQVIINGKVLSVGGIVDDVKVLHVHRGVIAVRFSGYDYNIKFNNTESGRL